METNNPLETLSSLAVTAQQQGYGIPMSPTQNRVVLKHDANDGQVSLLLPETDTSSSSKEKMIKVKSVSFVPLMTPLHLVHSEKDNKKRIDTSLSFGNVFDLYRYDNEHKSFGIKTPTDAYNELEAKRTYRTFGFIYAIDGKKPSSTKKIEGMFGDAIIPCFMDMRWAKFSKLLDAGSNAGVPFDGRPIVEGNIVTLTTDDSDSLKYEEDSYYYPNWTVTPLNDEQNQNMLDYSTNYRKILSDYRQKIFDNDEFLNLLFTQRLTKPRTVSILRDMGITSKESMYKTIETYGSTDVERFAKLREVVDNRLGVTPKNSGNVKVEVAPQQQFSPEMMAMFAQMQQAQSQQQMQQAQQFAGQTVQQTPVQQVAGTQVFPNVQSQRINSDTGLPF